MEIDDDIDYGELDPNIRQTVRFLREHGFDTTDSGDGKHKLAEGMECAIPYPNIAIQTDPYQLAHESIRLADLLDNLGIQLQPMGWNQAADSGMLSFDEDDGPDWDIKEAVEIEASYDPVDESAIILILHLDDTKLMAAGISKKGNN